MASAEDKWQAAKKVLCVRLDAIGDVVMTGPAIRAIKAAVPERHVTLLTSAQGATVARMIPGVDDVLVYDCPWMKSTPPRTDAAYDHSMISTLRDERFDAAVIFTVFGQNPLPAAMLCYLAGIPLRLAFCRENPYQLLTDWLKETEPESGIRHEVARQLDLVRSIGCEIRDERLSLTVPYEAELKAADLARVFSDSSSRWLLVHTGASAPSRRYPPALFADVLIGLSMEGFLPVLTGSAAERPLVDAIIREASVPAVNVAGQLTLAELAALSEAAPLVLTNNSGPAHIAAAVGTPVVDIYALTNPQHTPWSVPSRVLSHDVPCKNCFKSICPLGHNACLRMIEPKRVISAVLELFEETQIGERGGTHVHIGHQCSVS